MPGRRGYVNIQDVLSVQVGYRARLQPPPVKLSCLSNYSYWVLVLVHRGL